MPTFPEPTHYTVTSEEVMTFIREFFLEHDRLPALHHLCTKFNFKSTTTAYAYMQKLVEAGKLEKDPSMMGRQAWWRFPKAKNSL